MEWYAKPGRQWVSRGRILTETKDTNSLFGKVEGLINNDGELTYGIEVDTLTLYLSKIQKEKDEYYEEEARIEAELEATSFRIANEEAALEEANKTVKMLGPGRYSIQRNDGGVHYIQIKDGKIITIELD